MSLLEQILQRMPASRRESGGWYVGFCPVHEADGKAHKPSLRFKAAERVDDGVIISCMGGCSAEQLQTAYGLGLQVRAKTLQDPNTLLLYRPPSEATQSPGAETPAAWTDRDGVAHHVCERYRYTDEAGQTLYVVARTKDKQFPIWNPKLSRWKRGEARRVLYRYPQVLAAAKGGELVFIVEGEKDVGSLERLGLVATCNPGGAGKWRAEYCSALAGARVAILPDNDEPGRRHAQQVLASLQSAGVQAAIVGIAGLPAKGDVSDAIAAGMSKEDLLALVEEALQVQTPCAAAESLEGRASALPIHSVPELLAMDVPEPQYIIAPPLALARGTVVELDAYPKHGKTRLALDAIWSLLHGSPFLDAPTTKTKVLYLTEEWLITWRKALSEAHLLDEQIAGLHWMSLIDLQGGSFGDWEQICELLRGYCVANQIGLLVVDTLARWAKVGDENDAVAMAAAVLPLRLIAAEGVAVLFLRHDRKGGGALGESGRGSSATTGEADHILHLQRKTGGGTEGGRQRELEGIGRLAGMTGKLIIELGEFGHFELLGARSDVVYERACRHLLTVLPVRREEAWTLKELGSRFEGSESTLKRALDDLCRTGEITGQQRVGHAAQAKSKKAIGYWRPLEQQQEELVCDAG